MPSAKQQRTHTRTRVTFLFVNFRNTEGRACRRILLSRATDWQKRNRSKRRKITESTWEGVRGERKSRPRDDATFGTPRILRSLREPLEKCHRRKSGNSRGTRSPLVISYSRPPRLPSLPSARRSFPFRRYKDEPIKLDRRNSPGQ